MLQRLTTLQGKHSRGGDGNDQHKIRLEAIGAPESGQPYGTVSKDYLGKIVFAKQVSVQYDKPGMALQVLPV